MWFWDDTEAYLPCRIKDDKRDDGKVEIAAGRQGTSRVVHADAIKWPIARLSSLNESVEDMVKMDEVNEATILYNLRERFKNDDIYTNIGTILVRCRLCVQQLLRIPHPSSLLASCVCALPCPPPPPGLGEPIQVDGPPVHQGVCRDSAQPGGRRGGNSPRLYCGQRSLLGTHTPCRCASSPPLLADTTTCGITVLCCNRACDVSKRISLSLLVVRVALARPRPLKSASRYAQRDTQSVHHAGRCTFCFSNSTGSLCLSSLLKRQLAKMTCRIASCQQTPSWRPLAMQRLCATTTAGERRRWVLSTISKHCPSCPHSLALSCVLHNSYSVDLASGWWFTLTTVRAFAALRLSTTCLKSHASSNQLL